MNAASFATAFVTVVVALVGAFGGSAWYLRRSTQKLTESQASREDAEADKIRDELARSWIKDLQAEVENQRQRLTAVDSDRIKEQNLRRSAVAWALALMHWIELNMTDESRRNTIPRVPEDLSEYV